MQHQLQLKLQLQLPRATDICKVWRGGETDKRHDNGNRNRISSPHPSLTLSLSRSSLFIALWARKSTSSLSAYNAACCALHMYECACVCVCVCEWVYACTTYAWQQPWKRERGRKRDRNMQLQVEWLWIDFDCELQWKITTAMWKWKWKPNHGWTTLFSAKKHIPFLSHSLILSVLHFFLFPFIIFLLSTQFSLLCCPQKYAIKFMQPSKVCYKIYAMPQITENLIECVCIIVYVKVEGVAFSISIYYQKKNARRQ